MDENLIDLGEQIKEDLAGKKVSTSIEFDELTLAVPARHILKVLKYLRDDPACKFNCIIDICGCDYPERKKRFDVVYHLLSVQQNARIRVKIKTDEDTPVASATGLFPGADWYEREVFDLYGVVFDGHPDLRRILTDYGFNGHPLRKDFPLSGHVEVRYNEELKRVVYEPVHLMQEYRNFDNLSPWEGGHYVLPGDEKADEQ